MHLKSTKGGRNKKAPYETSIARIPVAISSYITFVSNSYKEAAENGTEVEFVLTLDKTVENITMLKTCNTNKIEQLALEVVKLRKQKKNTKTALESLLAAILGDGYDSQ